MKIYNARELYLCLVCGGQERGNLSEHFSVRRICIIKARRIYKVNGAVIFVVEFINVRELSLFEVMKSASSTTFAWYQSWVVPSLTRFESMSN